MGPDRRGAALRRLCLAGRRRNRPRCVRCARRIVVALDILGRTSNRSRHSSAEHAAHDEPPRRRANYESQTRPTVRAVNIRATAVANRSAEARSCGVRDFPVLRSGMRRRRRDRLAHDRPTSRRLDRELDPGTVVSALFAASAIREADRAARIAVRRRSCSGRPHSLAACHERPVAGYQPAGQRLISACRLSSGRRGSSGRAWRLCSGSISA